jgi:hypothetical protein
MKRIHSEIIINAPAKKIWEAIVDFDSYSRWNSFTPRITLTNAALAVGAEFDLDCRMTDRMLLRDEHEVVLSIDPDKFIFCMGTSRTRGRQGITSFRWQKCEPLAAGRTRFVNYEEFTGVLAPVVYALYAGKLRRAFEKYCRALKSYVEEL